MYFEQADSWGGRFPTIHNGHVRIKARVHDTFGNSHTRKFWVRSVDLSEARKYNPAFGKTFAELRGEPLPFDNPVATTPGSVSENSINQAPT